MERDNYQTNQDYFTKEEELLNKIETIFGENKDLRTVTFDEDAKIYNK